MDDSLHIDFTTHAEHLVNHFTQDLADAWHLWLNVFESEKAQLAQARYRIEHYIYPLLPDIEVNDNIVKCYYDGVQKLEFNDVLRTEMVGMVANTRRQVFVAGEMQLSPFQRYHNAGEHGCYGIDPNIYPYVVYWPAKWLKIPLEEFLEILEEVQSIFTKHAFITGSINWKDVRKLVDYPINKTKLREVLGNRYYLDNVEDDLAQVCVYIVLRSLELTNEDVSIDNIITRFAELINEDILLAVGEDGFSVQE